MALTKQATVLEQTAERIVSFHNDPAGFTAWAWSDADASKCQPLLERISAASAVGGPSIITDFDEQDYTALTAWLVLWFLLTKPEANICVTAKDVALTWGEVKKWVNCSVVRDWIEFSSASKSLSIRGGNEAYWWQAKVKPYCPSNPERFMGAGFSEYVLYVLNDCPDIDEETLACINANVCGDNHMLCAFGRTIPIFDQVFRRTYRCR